MVVTRSRNIAAALSNTTTPCTLQTLIDTITAGLDQLGPSRQLQGLPSKEVIGSSDVGARLEALSASRASLRRLAVDETTAGETKASRRTTRASVKETPQASESIRALASEVLKEICTCVECSALSKDMADAMAGRLTDLVRSEQMLSGLESDLAQEEQSSFKMQGAKDGSDQFKCHSEGCTLRVYPEWLQPISAEMTHLASGSFHRQPSVILQGATHIRGLFAAKYYETLTDNDADKPLLVYDGLCSCQRKTEVTDEAKVEIVSKLEELGEAMQRTEVDRLWLFHYPGLPAPAGISVEATSAIHHPVSN